jgi:hypothetical protein
MISGSVWRMVVEAFVDLEWVAGVREGRCHRSGRTK